ncbi:DUF6778 family protein [Aestuariicoccus sp. MJ-SS9]|uniref:DUF6778 family protein n=1 Tax=Aestuariicoccus sp. MJ-SS9 TaxID=3079855 RepID=UPI00290EBA27|nr:DUF6778 family protein [Aestuariicoccus sp. MJ-SS9]MDU8911266.1 DUF6778 family protein [Aestuariicoccus sp. MJ-SS9]
MKLLRIMALMGVAAGLSACAQVDTAMRNAPFETLPSEAVVPVSIPADHAEIPMTSLDPATLPAARPLPDSPGYRSASALGIGEVKIVVPQDLKVSEANLFYPWGDIVWRGDPYGNRKEQVAAIFRDALERARPDTAGARVATVEITLRRFHSVSEKTRYSIGGVHNIVFDLVLRDPESGAVLREVKELRTNLNALGGERAKAADRQGLTMKERIARHLRQVFVAELTHPGGYKNVGPRLAQAAGQI